MYTTLLVMIHISRTQKWAGGHRYAFRRNVCRPATGVIAKLYISSTKIEPTIVGSYVTPICEDIIILQSYVGDINFCACKNL